MTARHPGWIPPDPNERRQFWARDTRLPFDAPLVYVRPDEAETLRPDCRDGRLICPIPHCDAPRMTTRAGSRRDHFAHLSGGGHGPETLHHYAAKALIGAWARERHPKAKVTVDLHTVESGRKPDVLVEFDDGRRFAFEVQYAGLTETAWQARHSDYRRDGIIDIWLFGHVGGFLRPARSDAFDGPEPRFTLGPLLEVVDASSHRLVWIDPDERRLLVRRRHSGTGHDSWSKHGILRTVEVAPVELRLCRIEGRRLWTPLDAEEDEGRKIHEVRERKARQQEAEDHRRYYAELARERKERAHARTMRAAQAASWERYRAKVVETCGFVPPILLAPHRNERRMLLEPAHWHGLLVGSFVNHRVGQLFTSEEVTTFFTSRDLHDRTYEAQAVIEEYLYVLRRHGFVDFAARGPFLESPAVVLADCATPPADASAAALRDAIRNRSEDDELAYAKELKVRYRRQWATRALVPASSLGRSASRM